MTNDHTPPTHHTPTPDRAPTPDRRPPRVTVTTLATPDGPFSFLADDSGVLASGWTDDPAYLVGLIHPSLRPVAADVVADHDPASGTVARGALDAVRAYYAGDLNAVASVPVHQVSGPFREHAWAVLREVSPGGPVTYAEFAARSGRPAAVRAVAGACALNAAALFVPCHRVVRTDGSLGGFRYGLAVKESLLARERSAGAITR